MPHLDSCCKVHFRGKMNKCQLLKQTIRSLWNYLERLYHGDQSSSKYGIDGHPFREARHIQAVMTFI